MTNSKSEPELVDDFHRPRKRFGQNFLTDSNIIDNIVRAINPKPEHNLIEIGPGKGAISIPLISLCSTLTVIELDRDLAAKLRKLQTQFPNLTIVEADALKVDFAEFSVSTPMRIVGNLPYNISTPLLFHLLQFRHLISDMHFMLQKEVVDRLSALPNTKSYGRLSVMVQYYAEVEQLFLVPPGCFSPPPKVNSAIVRLQPFTDLPHVAANENLFSKLVSTCFQMRRKTLRNSLRKLVDDEKIGSLSINTGLRPENLSVAEFVQLSNELHNCISST